MRILVMLQASNQQVYRCLQHDKNTTQIAVQLV